MSFDWQHYYNLAKYMYDNVKQFPDEEACYRCVTSRAYYAAFCLARNHVKDKDNHTFSGNVHQALQRYLTQNPQQRDRRRIGNQLTDLHELRKKADYDDVVRSPKHTAGQGLGYARKIIEGLASLPK